MMGMREYIIRRILLFIPILIGATVLIFAVTQLFSPIARVSLYVDPTKVRDWDAVVEKYGLNDPAYIQYFRWITQILQGNLGYSKQVRMPVLQALFMYFPTTLELVLYSAPITIFLGIYLGVKSAVHKDKMVDHGTRVLAIIGWSLPSFWLAILLLSIFYGGFGVCGPGRLGLEAQRSVLSDTFISYTGLNSIDGLLNGQLWITLDALEHLVLPVLELTIIQIALIIRVMRSSMLEELNKGYILTARAKGLSKNEVINKHARKNALIPIATISGMLVAGMLTGVVITETVFNLKGIGYWAANSALHMDMPFVLGFAIFTAVLYVSANLIVDIMYAYLDPRIRLA
jgi:dipeptide transport system permease protein